MHDPGEVTRLLVSLRDGDKAAFDRLFALVYKDLRVRAHDQLARARGDQTLNTTALVHEAYLKLVGSSGGPWENRGHFFAVASKAMRHILVDHARRRRAQKRGGDARRIELESSELPVESCAEQVVALDEALTRLEETDERLGQVVELRFFGGLSVDETAETLHVSSRTVKRDWRVARAFLYRELASQAT